MSDRAEDLNEWRSEQYAKNAKSYESKVWLTVEEASAICDAMNPSLSDRKWRDLLYQRITGYIPIHSTPMEGKLILPKQAEGKE